MKLTADEARALLARQTEKARAAPALRRPGEPTKRAGPASGKLQAPHPSPVVWSEFVVPMVPDGRANARRFPGQEMRAKKQEKSAMRLAWEAAGQPRPALGEHGGVDVVMELVRPRLQAEDPSNTLARVKYFEDALSQAWGLDDGDPRRWRLLEVVQVKRVGEPAHTRVRFRVR